jgi:hypothetical protein
MAINDKIETLTIELDNTSSAQLTASLYKWASSVLCIALNLSVVNLESSCI